MSLEEFAEQLETLGYDVAKDEFPKGYDAEYPYIVYEVAGTRNFAAENVVYQKILSIAVSIYTARRPDEEAMQKLELLFEELELVWDKVEELDHQQYDYEVLYSVELIV